MTTFYMTFSLGLGLLSWILAFISLYRRNFGFSNLFSLTTCALSLLLQLMEINHLANDLEDFSAIMDTINSVIFSGWAMLIVAVLLNGIAIIKAKSR